MGTIADGCIAGLLAATEEDLATLFRLILYRSQVRVLVAAITEWLAGAASAAAPEVFLAGFNLYGIRGLAGDGWLGHEHVLQGRLLVRASAGACKVAQLLSQ